MTPFRRNLAIFVFICGATTLAGWLIVDPSSQVDPICQLTQKEWGMRCTTISKPDLYQLGALVQAPDPKADEHQPIRIPDTYFFSPECIFGQKVPAGFTWGQDSASVVAFPKTELRLNRTAQGKISTTIGGLSLDVGPSLSKIQSLDITADKAQFQQIDTDLLRTQLSSCTIRKACARRAESTGLRVVGRALVATGLAFSSKSSGSSAFQIKAEIEDGGFKLDSGPSSSDSIDKELKSTDQFIIAASLLKPDSLQGIQFCQSDLVILSHEGGTSASAYANVAGVHVYEKSSQSKDDGEVTSEILKIDAGDPVALKSFDGKPASHFAFRPLEALASGKWNINKADNSLEIIHTNFVSPAMKSKEDADSPLNDWDFDLVAGAEAEVRSTVNLLIGNRTDDARHLKINIEGKVLTNAAGGRFVGPYRYFDNLTVRRRSGVEVSYPVLWTSGEAAKDIELGVLAGGEAVEVRMVKSFSEKTNSLNKSGIATENVNARFYLSPD